MPTASALVQRFERMSQDRGTWEAHWEEIAERVLPRTSGSFSGGRTPGEKRTDKMLDATAALGLERFAAAMESMLTPRNGKWHRLRASNRELNKVREVGLWFDDVTDILFQQRYRPKANYASQQHETYIGLGAFGTGALFIDELVGGAGLRYKSCQLAGVYFLENHQGIIDTAYRKFRWTARQAAQKWGVDRLPDKIANVLESAPETEFEFLHAVFPRDNVDPTRADHRGMPFASHYIALEEKQLLSEGGYYTFPYAISRYVTAAGELYGRSPAMLALPAIKVLNEEKRTVLKQGHRVVDPVLLAHDDGVLDGFSMKPGAMNYGGVNADGRQLVHTLPTGNVAVGKDMMDDERAVINDAFLVSLFQILVDSPQMTATEVLERAREKGALLSPTMGRQQSEMLGPMIERELDLLARQGLLPEMPDALKEAEGEFDIEYDSPLSRAQKAEEASGLFRAVEFATNFATVTQDPSAFDHIDIDAAMPDLMAINAVPMRWQRGEKDIQQIRQGRQQQANDQQAIDAMPAVAGMMKGPLKGA